ncbi:MAG: response regulator [Candidatus Omnitrophica bacterium]|nr:response regulator [Candidatus Omnitrophota bacterium]
MSEKTRILIVDDEANFRNTLSKVLAAKGYETTTAESGLKALELMKEREFDAVLMDIKMPVMNGVETYKKMKSAAPRSVVILMTAYSVDELIKDAIKEGVYAVVRKPFNIETIINMLEKSKNGAFIAIVDDDPNISKTMKSVLEREGYSVNSCLTGEEAITLAKERHYDVFFIDMKLPALNGLEVYLEIRKINPKTVVVVMTAYRQEVDDLVKQAMEKGAYACLYKPFDMDEALKIITAVAKKK